MITIETQTNNAECRKESTSCASYGNIQEGKSDYELKSSI